jgi:hypothetical protein
LQNGFTAVYTDAKRSAGWSKARLRERKDTLKSRDIIACLNQHFQEKISMGSYDDIRRKDLKLPVVAGIIIASANKPNAARNDPKACRARREISAAAGTGGSARPVFPASAPATDEAIARCSVP